MFCIGIPAIMVVDGSFGVLRNRLNIISGQPLNVAEKQSEELKVREG